MSTVQVLCQDVVYVTAGLRRRLRSARSSDEVSRISDAVCVLIALGLIVPGEWEGEFTAAYARVREWPLIEAARRQCEALLEQQAG